MTEQEFQVVSRLEAWMRDQGHRASTQFYEDLKVVLNMARRPDVREILLSDEFTEKLADKLMKTRIEVRRSEHS